jgi:hypothetical protein
VDFQSWNPSPTHLLPETDPTAFTYLIDRYFRTRTNLTLTNNGTQIGGNLTSGGQGVANASVQLTSQALSGSGTIATYTLTGAVPNEAVMALVGARVNTECYACNGASDLTVYEFQYNDSNASELNSNEWDFSNALSDWTTVAPSPAVFTSGPAPYRQGLHITAQPGQTALLNSTFTGVSPGGQFTFQVTARVAPLSVGSGYFTLIWLDANQTEPSREIILFEPQTQMLTTATTAADGSFSASIPVDPNLYQVTAQYAGSSALWPSSAVVPSSPSSPPSIVSLTPAAGSGASAAFSAVFNDPNGWGAIANAQVLINTGPFAQGGCDIGYLPLTRTFQLLSDTGVWSSMVLSNNECSVSGMSASGSGNNLTLNFTVNFLASSRAQESVFLQVNDSQGLTVPWASAGTWSIVPTACTLSGATNLTDVQSTINQALGGAPAITDMNGDGTVNVVDVELVVSGFLGCAPFNSAAPAGSGTRTMAHSADRRERL